MLHILGMIVKIAGILLGSILGMILLALLLILFVPIRYNLKGSYHEKLNIYARVSWLLSVLRIEVQYHGEGVVCKVRLFGILLRRKKAAEKDPEQKEDNRKAKEKIEQQEQQKDAAKPSGQKQEIEKVQSEDSEDREERVEKTEEKKAENKKEKVSFREKIQKIREKIKYTIRNICDKIKGIKAKAERIKALIQDKKNWEAFQLIKQQMICLWKHIRPRKYSVSCRFGFDDPAVTGKALAAAAILYPWYQNHIHLYPDFEKKILSGDAAVKGRIRIFPLLLIIIRLWRNKQIRTAVRKFIK